MELKIKAKLDYMETTSVAKITRNIMGALRLMGIDTDDIGTTTADVNEFLDTLRDPNGREFPGYRLKFTGTMTDGELTIQMKDDDFAAVGDQVDTSAADFYLGVVGVDMLAIVVGGIDKVVGILGHLEGDRSVLSLCHEG